MLTQKFESSSSQARDHNNLLHNGMGDVLIFQICPSQTMDSAPSVVFQNVRLHPLDTSASGCWVCQLWCSHSSFHEGFVAVNWFGRKFDHWRQLRLPRVAAKKEALESAGIDVLNREITRNSPFCVAQLHFLHLNHFFETRSFRILAEFCDQKGIRPKSVGFPPILDDLIVRYQFQKWNCWG